ncbi:MAG TPA: phytanoyl-CoA dioxygenase family protein [Candidatus Binatia bacterium]|jgi:hypothetical protein|nr:phytanoyl-CoA dioxygenase family protein [Candidatus Binatia bacterium]
MPFDAFHRDALPGRLASPLGRRAARDVAGAPAIAFRLPDGRARRWRHRDGTIVVESSDVAPVVVELGEDAWDDFVCEHATVAGLRYAGRLSLAQGTFDQLERWEPALRAIFSDRPILDPAARPDLDLQRRFTLDDPPDVMRRFLDTTGFLHVRGVFSRNEIADLGTVVERARTAARPGDGRSWWAKRADGTAVLCRLIYLGLTFPQIAALSDDERLRRLAALGSEPLRPMGDRCDGHSVVIKHPDVVEGLSDLPWHRDCGLGGHPTTCPKLNLGVQLDAATAASGRLLFLAGSHRGSCHRADLDRPGLPIVAVDTEPGDCTLHIGDVLHAAPPPTGIGPGRRALYITWMPARAYDVIPAGGSYNDVVRAGIGNPQA